MLLPIPNGDKASQAHFSKKVKRLLSPLQPFSQQQFWYVTAGEITGVFNQLHYGLVQFRWPKAPILIMLAHWVINLHQCLPCFDMSQWLQWKVPHGYGPSHANTWHRDRGGNHSLPHYTIRNAWPVIPIISRYSNSSIIYILLDNPITQHHDIWYTVCIRRAMIYCCIYILSHPYPWPVSPSSV